jgi:hypothetical protein
MILNSNVLCPQDPFILRGELIEDNFEFVKISLNTCLEEDCKALGISADNINSFLKNLNFDIFIRESVMKDNAKS